MSERSTHFLATMMMMLIVVGVFLLQLVQVNAAIFRGNGWSCRPFSSRLSWSCTTTTHRRAHLSTNVGAPDLQAFLPMERVVLLANGNLQRLLSAYHNAPVKVKVKESSDLGNGTFAREIDLLIDGLVVCNAIGQVTASTEDARAAMQSGKVGVGQLLDQRGVLPTFRLLGAGKEKGNWKTDSNCYWLWREYELLTPQLHCRFRERFPPGFLSLTPAAYAPPKSA